ncbi:MAG: PIG-L family deacetylase [Bauldia sp.]
MLTDDDRIRRQRARPAILRLWQAMQSLRSVVTFLQTGAHPDDETTAMLAALRLRDGVRVVFACSTRGEGGQNAIGVESGSDLGALRSREMEAAAADIDLAVRWLSESADDPIVDFGFSKNAEETLARWGEQHTVERLVRIIRSERPDIVCPTFLDVSGQHGHHRAMTRATRRAVELAADPSAFADQLSDGLAVWSVAKFYLPAWSGAGQSYDDDLPPPNATVDIDTGGWNAVAGATYEQIAQWSRAGHRTQGMGRWIEPGPDKRPLHLAWPSASVPQAEASVLDNLPRSLADLAAPSDRPAFKQALAEAQAAVERTLAAWPDQAKIGRAAAAALAAVREAVACAPERTDALHGHRLRLKERQLGRVMFEAAGIAVRASASPIIAAAGSTATVSVGAFIGNDIVDAPLEPSLVVPRGWSSEQAATRRSTHEFRLHVPSDAPASDGYPATYDPCGGNGPVFVNLRFAIDGVEAVQPVDLEERLEVVPVVSLSADPSRLIVNLKRATAALETRLVVSSRMDEPATVTIIPRLPEGWSATPEKVHLSLPARGNATATLGLVPPAETSGRREITFAVDGAPAATVREMRYTHTGCMVWVKPAVVRVGMVHADIPRDTRIGYVGGGIDGAGAWLRRLGLEVSDLDAADLAAGDLSRFETILVGVFGFGLRPDLAASVRRLHDWIKAGGNLVTLYHRPWDGWDAQATPPAFLKIGHPSLRWRVTDEAAAVTHLEPGHRLLNAPNRIGPEDWAGWHKERGLYFAAEWDSRYVALLAMADPGETPLRGALLSAAIGRGRHTHTSLVFHHQMDELVPGAFRIMANLVAANRTSTSRSAA